MQSYGDRKQSPAHLDAEADMANSFCLWRPARWARHVLTGLVLAACFGVPPPSAHAQAERDLFGYRPAEQQKQTAADAAAPNATSAAARSEDPTVALLVIAFLAVLVLFRWNMIARATTRIYGAMLEAEIADLDSANPGYTPCVKTDQLIQRQRRRLEDLRPAGTKSPFDIFWWNGVSELSGMILMHALRRQRILLLTNADHIETQLQTRKARLAELVDDKIAANFIARIDDKTPTVTGIGSNTGARTLLLADAVCYLDDQADSAFSTMAGWHNKTFWLIVCALMLINGLSYAVGNAGLFLIGATGGLLSRLTYSLYRSNVPTDYGASWTKILLSPVVGALTGWGGVLLLHAAADGQILGSAFTLNWLAPNAAVHALALILGFSERLFTGILSQLDAEVAKKLPGATKTGQ